MNDHSLQAGHRQACPAPVVTSRREVDSCSITRSYTHEQTHSAKAVTEHAVTRLESTWDKISEILPLVRDKSAFWCETQS